MSDQQIKAERQPSAGAIALVTGANKGIGFEIARGLGAMGIVVLMGCRDEERGRKAAEKLKAEGIQAHSIRLDVTDRDTIRSAAEKIGAQFGRLDILVNNAGAYEEGAKPSEVDLDVVRRVYETNVFGAIAMIQAMLPLLLRSERGRIVNVSSAVGSLAQADKYHMLLAYNTSKTALNGVTVQFARELRSTPIKVNAANPGWCSTDMTRNQNAPRTAQQGSITAIRLATLPDDGPTGGFFGDDGPVPW